MTVRFEPSEAENLEFMADLFNAFDEARGIKRRKKWKVSMVVDRAIKTELADFEEQIGGWPRSDAERQKLLRQAGELAKRFVK